LMALMEMRLLEDGDIPRINYEVVAAAGRLDSSRQPLEIQ
jgi:hypothetical protein